MRLRNVLEIMWPKLGEQEKARVKALLSQAKGEGAPEPKKLFVGMPVIYIAATTIKEKKAKAGDFGQFGPYDVAIYKYPKRNDRYLIFRMMLKTEVHPYHWKLRGVCLVAQTE